MVQLSDALKKEYSGLFQTIKIDSLHLKLVEDTAIKAVSYRSRYEKVISDGDFGKLPWFFIAAIHCLESSFDFSTHLHNGDPLSRKTSHVPSGRPIKGNPPFSWEESAIDALEMKGFMDLSWSLPELLWRLEGYNGWGYRSYHSEVLTPYLWSFSQHYTKGKYKSDGKFDHNLVSKQVGAAVLIKKMLGFNMISESDLGIIVEPPTTGIDPISKDREVPTDNIFMLDK